MRPSRRPRSEKAERRKPCAIPANTAPARTQTIIQSTSVISDALALSRQPELAPGEAPERLKILRQSPLHYIVGETRRRSLFVPANAFKIIPYELFVERRLSAPGLPQGRFPESRRIGSENFVGKRDSFSGNAKL